MSNHALTLLADCFESPQTYWPEPRRLIQVQKALSAWRNWSSFHGNCTQWLADIYAAVQSCTALKTVYISGLGGSGSHWLGQMLAEQQAFIDCGEVYFPPQLMDYLSQCPESESRTIILTYQLLHADPRFAPDIASVRFLVNTAAGIQKADLYRQWEPQATIVYLARDPRDQVLSTTFRKAAFRNRVYPELDDQEYLSVRAQANWRSFEGALSLRHPPTVTVRYEDLKRNTRDTLKRIFDILKHDATAESIDALVHAHDAELIRQGIAQPRRGNLDEGGISKGWANDAKRPALAYLHATLQDPILGLGYHLPDLWESAPRALTEPPASLPNGAYPISLRAGQWRRYEPSDLLPEGLGIRCTRRHKMSAADLLAINNSGIPILSWAGNNWLATTDFSALPPVRGLEVLDVSAANLPIGFLAWLAASKIATLKVVSTEIAGRPARQVLEAEGATAGTRCLVDWSEP